MMGACPPMMWGDLIQALPKSTGKVPSCSAFVSAIGSGP